MTDPLQQHLVPFYGDELVAVQQEDGTICILFGRLCENLGLDRRGQVRRTQRHSVLDKGLLALEVQTAGGPQTLQCLKLSLLPLWLSGVQARRVKPELQEKLVRYQEEAADVLWQAFKPQILAADTAVVSVDDSQAVQQLQQIELQRQQQALTQRMDGAARVIRGVQQDVQGLQGHLTDVEVRLGVLEDRLHPAASVTDEQATQVSNQVKALAELLSGTEHGKNHYQGIFAELYRRFGVSSYKLIRQDQYTAVLRFLEDWRRTSGG